jgi:hypothetical protein
MVSVTPRGVIASGSCSKAREETIQRVYMQSLFPTPYYRLFVVQEGDRDPGSPPADSRQPSAPSPSPSDLAFEAGADQRLINDYTAV